MSLLPPPSPRHPGVTLWFTGLSGAGKTTLSRRVGALLEARGHRVEYLDGDEVRTHLSRGLGFSRQDRDTNIERIAWVASRLTGLGAVVIVAAISPYAEARARARALVERSGRFVEIHVDASLAECERRDVKGLYARARRGELRGFTGVDDPYEPPVTPEVRVDSERSSPDEGAAQVLRFLEGSVPARASTG